MASPSIDGARSSSAFRRAKDSCFRPPPHPPPWSERHLQGCCQPASRTKNPRYPITSTLRRSATGSASPTFPKALGSPRFPTFQPTSAKSSPARTPPSFDVCAEPVQRRSALSPAGEPLRHAAGSGALARLPRQSHLRGPDSPPHWPSAQPGPASPSRQRRSAAAGSRRRQQLAERPVVVVAELYGLPLDETVDVQACRTAQCPCTGRICDGGGNRDMARVPAADPSLGPVRRSPCAGTTWSQAATCKDAASGSLSCAVD